MRKGTILAIVVFLGLAAAAYFSLRQPEERGVHKLSFPGYEKDKVTQLTITGPNPVDLKKTDGKWMVSDGKPADENAVKAAIEAIAKIDSEDVVTSRSDKYADMEVDDTKGTHVVAWAGAKHAAEFTIGKSAAGAAHIRSGDTVYSVRGVSSFTFSKPAAQWHQLKLFTDTLDDVSRVDVALTGSAPYAIVKKDGKWDLEDAKIVPAGFRFDADAARSFVSTLVNASAKEILDKDPGAATTGLGGPADTFTFTGKDGAKHELHLGAALADKSVYAKVAGRDETYTLAEYMGKNLRKAALDFRALTMMKVEMEKVTALNIASGKTSLSLEKADGAWKLGKSSESAPANFEFDPSLGASRVTQVANARALRMATEEEAKKANFSKPSATVTLKLEGGGQATLAFTGEGKDGTTPIVYARGNADSAVYVAAKALADRLTGGVTTFQKRAAPASPNFDASQLANLPPDVRAQLMQQLQQKRAMGSLNLPVQQAQKK
jgi:hypothetical protein